MTIKTMGFSEFIRAAHVKRWHVVNTTREQNLAEHQYMVTLIALELRQLLELDHELGDCSPFILAALFHDAAEIRYGDVPTPGKRFIEQWKPDLFDAIDAAVVPEIPYTADSNSTRHFDQRFVDIIQLADRIEAAWWITENGAGRHAAAVANNARHRVREFLAEQPEEWLPAANAVLSALSMPTIEDVPLL